MPALTTRVFCRAGEGGVSDDVSNYVGHFVDVLDDHIDVYARVGGNFFVRTISTRV